MNCNQAKQLNIKDFLYSNGYKPAKIYGNYLWYHAPYRKDETPSFKIDTYKNQWYDVGLGTGGNIIDLVMLMYNVPLKTALDILQGTKIQSFSFQFEQENFQKIQVREIKPIQHKALIQYLTQRKINIDLARLYVVEAIYTVNDTPYFGLAFRNDKQGYELRNKYFKGCASPKWITTIKGNSEKLNVFEGFFDFLSALEWHKTSRPANTTVILNSTANKNQLFPLIPQYKTINLYLDNDRDGQNTTSQIMNKHTGAINRALEIYPNHNDFNEFIINQADN